MSPLKLFSGWDAYDWFTTVFRLFLSALVTLPVPIVLNLLPYFDIGREEARRIQTWHETRRIAGEIMANSDEALQKIPAEKDVWGNSYRVDVMPGGTYRVSSPGGDRVYNPPNTEDSDDIHSEMESPPTDDFKRQRRRQWITAFAVWGICGAAIFVLLQRRAAL